MISSGGLVRGLVMREGGERGRGLGLGRERQGASDARLGGHYIRPHPTANSGPFIFGLGVVGLGLRGSSGGLVERLEKGLFVLEAISVPRRMNLSTPKLGGSRRPPPTNHLAHPIH